MSDTDRSLWDLILAFFFLDYLGKKKRDGFIDIFITILFVILILVLFLTGIAVVSFLLFLPFRKAKRGYTKFLGVVAILIIWTGAFFYIGHFFVKNYKYVGTVITKTANFREKPHIYSAVLLKLANNTNLELINKAIQDTTWWYAKLPVNNLGYIHASVIKIEKKKIELNWYWLPQFYITVFVFAIFLYILGIIVVLKEKQNLNI